VRSVVISLVLPLLAFPSVRPQAAAGVVDAEASTVRDVGVTGANGVVRARATSSSTSSAPSTAGTLAWPLRGPIVRGYEQPANPYAAGHRGIDIGAPYGTPIKAAADGVVHFAGKVAGSLFVSIDHAGGLQTTYSWVSEIDTKKGATVRTGDVIARSGTGHPGSTDPTHLHFGVKKDGDYVDPMLYLTPVDVAGLIRLAPLAA
jgi:murein DD-endopeptidase MepM/ murein hydrolase activator NlpD